MNNPQEVRGYAAAQEGMAHKSADFRAPGGEIYIAR
jgi:hypothetical protein